MLASKDRQLVLRDFLKLLDSKGRPSSELTVFLFTDLLLLTERTIKNSKGAEVRERGREGGRGEREASVTREDEIK